MTISVRRIPKDHTSDLMLNVPKLMASGAVHLIGNLAPIVVRKNYFVLVGGERGEGRDFVHLMICRSLTIL